MKQSLKAFCSSFVFIGVSWASPPVKVTLRSSWPAPPPLIEILETIALETPDSFFPLVDKLTNPDVLPLPHKMSPEAVHQAALQIASSNGYIKGPSALASVEMYLALHAATPKIDAFYNHYADHHNNTARDSNCGSWVDWYGKVICDIEELVSLAGLETIDPTVNTSTSSPFPRPRLLTFDHIYPLPHRTLDRPPRTAIFYASPFSENFRELHTYLLSLADKPNPLVEYVFRYTAPATRERNARSCLSGYGASLNLKKTDYLAIDDRSGHNAANRENSRKTDESESFVDPIMALIHQFPENVTAPSAKTPLNEEEIYNIGRQAVQLISSSSTPLQTLTTLTQNFPKYAAYLSRRVLINESLSSELESNSIKVQPGANGFWINGAVVEDDKGDVSPFGIGRIMGKERRVVEGLVGAGSELGMEVGWGRKEVVELFVHPSVAGAQKGGGGGGEEEVLEGLFDASDRVEGGGVIVYWNDMEKDTRYGSWSPSLFTLLQPVFRGIPSVKLNLFNVVLILDLSRTTSLTFVTGPMANIIERGFPLRFGVVPLVETEDGRRMAHLFYHLVSNYGRKKTLAFLQEVSEAQPTDQEIINWSTLERLFDEFSQVESSETDKVANLEEILAGKTEHSAPLEKALAYSERLGATTAEGSLGHVFFNGKHFDFNDQFLRNMQNELGRQMQFLQEQVYEGKISDANNATMATFFYDQPTTNSRRNRYIYPASSEGSLRIFNQIDLFSRTGFRVASSSFIYPPGTAHVPLSLYVVADLDSEAGLELVKEALSSITPDSRMRVSFIHNPPNDPTETINRPPASWLIAHLIKIHTLSKTSSDQLLRALGVEVSYPDGAQTVLSQDEAMRKLTEGMKVEEFDARHYAEFTKAGRLVAREMQVLPGHQALLVNGRVVGPIASGDFHAIDFEALESYEFVKRAEPVVKALEDISPLLSQSDRATYANFISMASSAVAAMQVQDPSEFSLFQTPQRPRQRQYQLLDSQYTAFQVGDNSTALFHIAVIMDPLGPKSQRWSSLLQWLSSMPDTYIEVHLNPAHRKEMPLKNFYRYNLLHSLSFDENGEEVPAQVVFEDLPIEPIYTLAMDVPSSWLVRPREALYDLDNIQLGNLSPDDESVDAVFHLDYLVIEGHAREVPNNNPPRGVQLELLRSSSSNNHDHTAMPIDDTQVVANLGYFQFKATPGVFGLEIRSGRGRNIYKMESAGNEGWYSPAVEESGNEITLTSFEGLTLYPRLTRKLGMEKADVLEVPKPESNLSSVIGQFTSRVSSLFRGKEAAPLAEEASEINIFTVASGLLYERFASIMILSVLRNTKSTVKFWFIENFLSPSFLEFIPHFAKKYNFKYELVTYKWPSWLREQTEKQRIIWGYKILFLDVLFPMDLKKVIFVDADQIVRADLKELVDLDLQGAPYGYTPMGDDNTDMEGFRFWKTGYWKEFLQGRPYHISALYVIDLVRFRQLAAGDILRGQYQQLSADPHSLANLDQDLPNNLQRDVPIFSLHEDWLWCETWCSKDRLHRAKTIDLCQNPLTKEPKLSRARQIPEWEEYDAEIARFTRDLAEAGLIHSRVATADTNVLANVGAVNTGQTDNSDKDSFSSTDDHVPERDEL